jgi:hypothetical protein
MSTKTTFKRVALVTVAALGFGVLTSVAPASAVATSFSLNTTSQTIVANNTTDSVGALIRIKVTSDTAGTLNSSAFAAGETLTAKVTAGPAIRTGATSSPLVIPTSGLAMNAAGNDLAMTEMKGQALATVTDWATVSTGHTTDSAGANVDTVTATASAPFDGAIGSENTSYTGQEPYATDTASSKSRYVYVSIMPREAKIASVIDAGVYTITFTLTDANQNVVGTSTLKIDFVSSKSNSGALLSITKGGTFTAGVAVAPTGNDATTADVYAYATLTNRDGGPIRSADGNSGALTTSLRLADATSDTVVPTSSDGGTAGTDWGSNDALGDGTMIKNNGVYGISIPAVGAAGVYTLKALYGAASATAALTYYAASGAYTATAASVATGQIGSTPTYTVPLTTKSAVVTVTVLTGTTAVQDYPVTFTTTWSSCAAGDATPVSGATGSSVVLTNSSGKASLTVTCNSPADASSASVAWVAGGTAGAAPVTVTWAKSKPATVTVDPAGPMTVALKAVTKATFTVLDSFGAPVAGEVVNLTVTGSNNTTASPLLIPSATTDANGQVSYTLTDALAIAAGTDAIKATTVTGSKTATLTVTYAATAPAAASMKVYYDALEATWTTLVPATTIYRTGTDGFSLAQGKNIAKTLVPGTKSGTDDVVGFNAYAATSALAAASGVKVTVSVSDGGWILTSAGLPVKSRDFYTSSTGYTGLINVTATTPGTKTLTFTSGTVTSTAAIAFQNTDATDARFITLTAGSANATAAANANALPSFTVKVTDGLGNAVKSATLNIVVTGVGRLATGGKTAQWTTDSSGEYTFELTSTTAGATTVTVTGTNADAQYEDLAGYISDTAQANTALAAGNISATGTVTFAEGTNAAEANAQAATDAAAEATDAANAATDAANAAAEAADAATAAAQDAADAVAALSAQVSSLISGLKSQLTALTNLVIKIQKKVKA